MSDWNSRIANALMGYAKDDPSTGAVRNSLMDMVTNRGTFVPLADYADGTTRMAWPGILHEPASAWAKMLGGDASPGNALQVAGAAMAGSVPFGKRLTPPPAQKSTSPGITEWDVMKHTQDWQKKLDAWEPPPPVDPKARSRTDDVLKSMIGPPQSANVYHGSSHAGLINRPYPKDVADGLWTTTRPDVANTYTATDEASGIGGSLFQPMVAPARASFERPFVIDANGAPWDNIPFQTPDGRRINFQRKDGTPWNNISSDDLSDWARRVGADGLIIRNVLDSQNTGDIPSDIWHAIKPQTVQGRYSPEYLYSGGPGAAAAGLLSAYYGGQDR